MQAGRPIAAGSLTAGRSYRPRRSMPDRRSPGRRRSMPVRRSCSGPLGGPRSCWRLSACPRRSSLARRSPGPRRSPGFGGLLGLAEPVSPGRVSSVPLGLPFLSVGRFMPVYLPFGSCSAARHWAPPRRLGRTSSRRCRSWHYRSGRSSQVVRPRSPTRGRLLPVEAGVAGRTEGLRETSGRHRGRWRPLVLFQPFVFGFPFFRHLVLEPTNRLTHAPSQAR